MGWCWEWRTCCTRTLGEQVSLRTELAASLWSALADDDQLENAILSVAINSQDDAIHYNYGSALAKDGR